MAQNYIIQPGDFLVNANTYSYNKNTVFAIFEGTEIYSSQYATANPDYSLLVHYESHPYCYNGDSTPTLEVATKDKPCTHKIYIIENPSMWRKCTEAEKEQFIDILREYGYIWDEETWSLVDANTGELIACITKPKLEYNGAECKHISTQAVSNLLDKCKTDAKKIYMQEPPAYCPVTHQSGAHNPEHNAYYQTYHEYEIW